MAPATRPGDERRRLLTTLGKNELRALLGPAEAQYGERLVLGLLGDQTPQQLACGTTIVDNDVNDLCFEEGCVRVDFEWNDLSGETGYRAQLDFDSAAFVEENNSFELYPGVTSSLLMMNQDPGTRTHTIRVFGHVGHAPAHGASPIAGDVVSNECSVTFVVPDIEPPA